MRPREKDFPDGRTDGRTDGGEPSVGQSVGQWLIARQTDGRTDNPKINVFRALRRGHEKRGETLS